jgi:hypothetical protein
MGAVGNLGSGHDWRERKVWLSGKLFLHLKCHTCRRGFVASQQEPRWRAVHVGLIQFEFLDDEITEQWMSEKCPGEVLRHDGKSPKVRSSITIEGR